MSKRRFIAGAVCPGCRATDTICVASEEGDEVMICVDCGYRKPKARQWQTIQITDESVKEP